MSKTETAKNAGFPEGMSYEEMKKQMEEFNKLNRLVKLAKKTMSKEEQKKIGISQGKKRREISEEIKPFIKKVFKLISEYQNNILSEFKLTITDEKPDGQKWLTFTSDDGITFCINKNAKDTEEEKEEEKE